MNLAALQAILGVIRVGGMIAKGFVKKDEVAGYIDLGIKATEGSEAHIEAQSQIEQWLAHQHTPTPEELAEVLKAAGVAHTALQTAVDNKLKGLTGGAAS